VAKPVKVHQLKPIAFAVPDNLVDFTFGLAGERVRGAHDHRIAIAITKQDTEHFADNTNSFSCIRLHAPFDLDWHGMIRLNYE
jgi:hypothetical protein